MLLRLVLFALPALLATALSEKFLGLQTDTVTRTVDPTLVWEIERLRQEWDIPGAAVAIVRQEEDGSWTEDVFGLGVADGLGTEVTGDVSRCSFLLPNPSNRTYSYA